MSLATVSFSLSPYVHRAILDIRQGNEFTIAVPYAAVANWTPVKDTQASAGSFALYVLDPLIAPSTVSTSVGAVVEVYGGDDLQFAQPGSFTLNPYVPANPQSGLWRPDECSIQDEVIGGASIHVTDVHDRMCIGEKITSLRSLLKGIGNCRSNPTDDSTTQAAMDINPWTWGAVTYLGGTGTPTANTQLPDYYNIISPCYALFRGSMVYHIRSSQNVKVVQRIQTLVASSAPARNIVTYTSFANGDDQTGNPVILDETSFTGGVSTSVPYYGRFHSCPTADMLFTTTTAVPDLTQSHQPMLYVQTFFNINTIPVTYRAVGDDFHFGGFISIPPFLGTI